MPFISKIVNLFFTSRRAEIDRFREQPAQVQQEQLSMLVKELSGTNFGRDHGILTGDGYREFVSKVPVTDYESFSPYIARAKAGEENITWPGDVRWFAKSSGTTDAKSKYIPVTASSLKDSHLRGPRDVIAFFSAAYPESNVFSGKTLTLGGSRRIEREGEKAFTGDLSAILLENTPPWANMRRVPSVETALVADFDEKVERICRESVGQNVTSFAGVPSWNLVLLNRILEYTGKNNILEVWPQMELFIHGGMNFRPYQGLYNKIIPSPEMKYMETYNASEGFFAIADDPLCDDMLLMLDYGTFYEFIPTTSLSDHSSAVPIAGVTTGVNYAMVISSTNGLWRYMIGDTVTFTSVSPYRIKISGRTKHFINVFGEEVMVENAETALREACDATGAEATEFSVGPVFMDGRAKGTHQWVIEFLRRPVSMSEFTILLDKALQKTNSDYEAKRFRDTTLSLPIVSPVDSGTFMAWMENKGKVGGQNKVPRLYNERTYIEELLSTGGTRPDIQTTEKPITSKICI